MLVVLTLVGKITPNFQDNFALFLLPSFKSDTLNTKPSIFRLLIRAKVQLAPPVSLPSVSPTTFYASPSFFKASPIMLYTQLLSEYTKETIHRQKEQFQKKNQTKN